MRRHESAVVDRPGAAGSRAAPAALVVRILDAIPSRYRALALLGTFASLRFGELASLRRPAVDLNNREVWVRKSQAELRGGRLVDKDPKSAAGKRAVAIPATIVPELREHLRHFAEPRRDGRVFVGPNGGRLRRCNFLRVDPDARQGRPR